MKNIVFGICSLVISSTSFAEFKFPIATYPIYSKLEIVDSKNKLSTAKPGDKKKILDLYQNEESFKELKQRLFIVKDLSPERYDKALNSCYAYVYGKADIQTNEVEVYIKTSNDLVSVRVGTLTTKPFTRVNDFGVDFETIKLNESITQALSDGSICEEGREIMEGMNELYEEKVDNSERSNQKDESVVQKSDSASISVQKE